jgi:hypothetical protein
MQSPCISQQFADKFLLLVVSVTDLVFCETRHYTEEVPEFLEAFGKFFEGPEREAQLGVESAKTKRRSRSSE